MRGERERIAARRATKLNFFQQPCLPQRIDFHYARARVKGQKHRRCPPHLDPLPRWHVEYAAWLPAGGRGDMLRRCCVLSGIVGSFPNADKAAKFSAGGSDCCCRCRRCRSFPNFSRVTSSDILRRWHSLTSLSNSHDADVKLFGMPFAEVASSVRSRCAMS
jgi:hypothetical protein